MKITDTGYGKDYTCYEIIVRGRSGLPSRASGCVHSRPRDAAGGLDHVGDDDIARERRATPRPTTPAPMTATSASSVMRKPVLH